MKHKNTQKLTLAAMTAAAYAALSLLGAVFGLTFGPIQVRFSEALCLLPFLFPETAWGLGVGCLIANLFSPYGALDIVVGSLSTLIAALLTARCRSPWTAALPPVVCNMVLVGAVLAYETAGTSAAFWPAYGLNALTVGLGEAIACLVLGVLLALVIKTFATGARSEDLLGSYICAGIGGALMAQIAVNVGMNLRLLPVIGVTLPFYSAGGSSVLMLYICVGLVLSVYMHNTKSLFG